MPANDNPPMPSREVLRAICVNRHDYQDPGALGSQATHQRRGPADGGELPQAAGAAGAAALTRKRSKILQQ